MSLVCGYSVVGNIHVFQTCVTGPNPVTRSQSHTANYTSCQAVKTLDYKSENMGSNPILCEMYLVYGVLAELANCT